MVSGSFDADWHTLLEAQYPLVVALWCVGLGLFSLRFAWGLYSVYSLKNKATTLYSDFLQEKMQVFAAILGIRRTVRLLESSAVKAPLTFGHLKPIILVPLGWVNQLSPAEAEAALAEHVSVVTARSTAKARTDNSRSKAASARAAVACIARARCIPRRCGTCGIAI